ncbi:hypothetical protein B7R22_17055 [Subtercola boreus]|uniref:Uncharacterized protein n=1 Tax=Subtercola boreus TaxID=120213 RepID=A0A3E0VRB1_9MICO|nr:hypothetical protein [Subtercola boreus]RFA12139.1 hypothetical protein B7R22_17055 [Subtercola boreus]
MRIHRFSIDENERRTKAGVLHHMRRFITVWRGTEADENKPDFNERKAKLFAGHLETILRKPQLEASMRFHVGTAASETPFDGHLTILGSGFFWGIENGRKLADWITREKAHKWGGRDLSLRIFGESGSCLYWSLWTHPDRQERDEFAKWREGSARLNALDRIYGSRTYTYERGAWALIAIDLPEGVYSARVTITEQSYGRPKSKRPVKSTVLEVDSPQGIPDHYDPSGGWKGDRVHGFSVPFRKVRDDWEFDAVNAVKAYIYRERARTGFREAQAVDA